jgi:hypothetical protein
LFPVQRSKSAGHLINVGAKRMMLHLMMRHIALGDLDEMSVVSSDQSYAAMLVGILQYRMNARQQRPLPISMIHACNK